MEERPTCENCYFPDDTTNSILTPFTIDDVERYQTNIGLLDSQAKVVSNSASIDAPDDAESSNQLMDVSSGLMVTSSLCNTDNPVKHGDSILRQDLGLTVASSTASFPEDSQPLFGYVSRYPTSMSNQPIFETPNIQAPPYDECFQQALQVTETPHFSGLNVTHSGGSGRQSGEDEEEDEEDEISPVEYARRNGLSRNYLQTPYLVSKLDLFGECTDKIIDDRHLPQFELKAIVHTEERLSISKDAAVLMPSVSCEGSSEWIDSILLRMIDTRKCKKSKLELPLLKSDHETDCKTFAKRDGFEIKLQNVVLPLEMVDENDSGGLGFSTSTRNKGAELLQEIMKEKLEVTRDTLLYLQETLKIDRTADDDKNIWGAVHKYKRNTALEPVTPPLSPEILPAQPFEPSMSDPVFKIPILSDPESLTKKDLERIEEHIFTNDLPTPVKNARDRIGESSNTLNYSDTVKMADVFSPVAFLDRPPVSPRFEERNRIKWDDLKVEEPLTPTMLIELPKAIQFDDMIIKRPMEACSPSTNRFESSYFEEAFGEAHQKATRMSEQESLIAADTTARVDVPIMDFSLPIPPWHALSSQSTPNFAGNIHQDANHYGPPKWPSNGKPSLRWNPFPRELVTVALEEESADDDSNWQVFVKDPKDDDLIDISIFTWKRPGLKILEDDDDDDELELAQSEYDAPHDILYLAKKRKMEIAERVDSNSLANEGAACGTFNQFPPKKDTSATKLVSRAKLQLDRADRGSLLIGDIFSVGNSVNNFLEIRGTKKPRLYESSFFMKTPIAIPAKPNHQSELPPQLSTRESPAPKIMSSLPAPPNRIANTPVNVIVASMLLKRRALIRQAESLASKMILIERDFSAHDTTIWMPGSVARSPIASPLASEADIIVSPLVGIIITTLQKVKQKALPGQKTKVAIRGRLEKVSARYEKIIVLVTEGRPDETARELDDSDCIAFSEFVSFAITLPATISVQYVGGGDSTLAKWLVSSISSHKVDVELLAEETHWELFLRRAGLNPFAAQAVILNVKAPENVNASNSSKAAHFGLTAFVEMGKEQRIARFGHICGNRLIERVGAAVDAIWS